ncbi:transcription termination factor MTERF8, chloroplastic-like [Silene latifolia]|uniref:transcription termination factor MTERF8, chloroplastic-like n=1 Tax=Silene latifolia TaxID=37657 RepID=UPI003D780F57
MLKLSINGVKTIFSAHNFKWVSNYTSVASKASEIPNSMVDYLVNSLGFSKEEAFVTCSKVSTTFKSTENPNSVVDFFKISGFSQSQIKQLVSKEPRILSSNVDKTLNPKIQALHDLGFSKSDLAHVISLYPDFCHRSLNDHIIPTIEILKSIFGDDNEVLIHAVKKWPWLLGKGAKEELPDLVSLLKSYRLSDHQIKLFALWKTRNLLFGTKSLEPVLIRVENLGIPRGSGMFFHGICALCSSTEASLDARKRIYKSYGFNDEDVLTLVRRNPHALVISESKLRNGLDFFMKEAGYLPSQIAHVPNVLTYSLEKRVIPRYRVWKGLKERGIQKVTNKKIKNVNVAFFSCLTISEPRFFEKFVQPFKDECPDIYSDYVKVARPALF